MDVLRIREYLTQAERHVALGCTHFARRIEIVDELECGGRTHAA
jgi:hypothetical protein